MVGGRAVHALGKDFYLKERPALAAGYIKEFIKTHRIASPDIFMGIPRELVLMREVEFPLAIKENLRVTVAYELEKYLPFPPEEAVFDCQVIAEDKQNSRITVLLAAIKKKDLAPYLELINQMEWGFSGLEISSTALTNQAADLSGSAFLLAYQGENGVEINCIRNGLLQLSRLIHNPSAGESLDSFWEREFRPVKEYLSAESEPMPVYYYGKVDAIAELLKKDADLAFCRPDATGSEIQSPVFLPAMGLALKGLQKVPMQLNLLPERLRKKPSRIQYYMLFVLAGLLLLSLLLWGGGKVIQQRIVLNQLNDEITRLQSEIKTLDRIQADSHKIEACLELLNHTYHEYPSVLEILRELSQRIPDTAWTYDFVQNKRELQINGVASSAADLIPLIEESPFFKEVVFLSPITRDKEGREEFRIGMKLE